MNKNIGTIHKHREFWAIFLIPLYTMIAPYAGWRDTFLEPIFILNGTYAVGQLFTDIFKDSKWYLSKKFWVYVASNIGLIVMEFLGCDPGEQLQIALAASAYLGGVSAYDVITGRMATISPAPGLDTLPAQIIDPSPDFENSVPNPVPNVFEVDFSQATVKPALSKLLEEHNKQ